MNKPKAPRHLLVRTEVEPFRVERFKAICGANGITKRDYRVSIADVDCPLCLQKINKKGRTK
jgi:hypothetical protein